MDTGPAVGSQLDAGLGQSWQTCGGGGAAGLGGSGGVAGFGGGGVFSLGGGGGIAGFGFGGCGGAGSEAPAFLAFIFAFLFFKAVSRPRFRKSYYISLNSAFHVISTLCCSLFKIIF